MGYNYRNYCSLLKYFKMKRFEAESCKIKSYKELAEKGIKIIYGNNKLRYKKFRYKRLPNNK